MKRVDRWECEDGSLWDSAERARTRDCLLAECGGLVADLGLRDTPPDGECAFANGAGCVQQPRGSRAGLLSFIQRKQANRDTGGPIGELMHRMRCMDDRDREWGQPYFAINPDKAEHQRDVGATKNG